MRAGFSVLAGCRVASLLAGCDRNDAAIRGLPSEAPRASAALALGVFDAGEFMESPDPPALVGDLAAEIDAFTTVDACVDRRARIDPLVGDVLETIGYDTLLRDACRLLDAAKAKDARRCIAIGASPLRIRCDATVAELSGAPDACPWDVDTHRERGRDASCIALASGDPRLCVAAEDPFARATCAATAGRSPAPCDALGHGSGKTRCVRDASRWGPLLARGATAHIVPFAPSGKLTVSSAEADGPMQVLLTDEADELGAGVVAVVEHAAVRLSLGPFNDYDSGFVAASPHTRTTLAVEVVVPAIGKGARQSERVPVVTAHTERVQLAMAGRQAIQAPPATSTLAASVGRLDAVRGGAVDLTIDGDLEASDGTWHVHAEIKTFVRDVVTTEALYEVGARRFGGGTEMR